jgi:hypothetical protein
VHACSGVVVLMDYEVMAMLVLVALIQGSEIVNGKALNIWGCLARCFCKAVLEVREMVVDLCLACFDCC